MSTQDPTPPSTPDPYGASAPRYGEQPAAGSQPASGEQPGYGQGPVPPPVYGDVSGTGAPAPYSGGPGYVEPGYVGGGGGGVAAPRNGVGLAALITGIAALLLGIIPFLGFLGIAAVVLGIIGLSRVRKRVATNRGMAIAGIVLGALAILAAIAWTIGAVLVAQQAAPALEQCASLQSDTVAYQQCLEDNLLQNTQ